jgi:hypothetical protein
LSGSKPPISPRECALLFGVPLTWESFRRKLDGPRDGNFAEGFRAKRAELSWMGYEPLARRLSETAQEAESLGVRVFREMSLSDIPQACQYEVVTIISHWRSAQFKPADIVNPAEILHAFQLVDCAQPPPSDPDGLARWLNAHFLSFLPDNDGSLGAAIRFQSALVEKRASITSGVPRAFRGGAGVEFSDGFKEISAITAHVPDSFVGVFDLTICNSLLLAESLHHRYPHCLVIATSDLTFPDTRLPFYLATIRLLSKRPAPYEDTFETLKRELRRRFR